LRWGQNWQRRRSASAGMIDQTPGTCTLPELGYIPTWMGHHARATSLLVLTTRRILTSRKFLASCSSRDPCPDDSFMQCMSRAGNKSYATAWRKRDKHEGEETHQGIHDDEEPDGHVQNLVEGASQNDQNGGHHAKACTSTYKLSGKPAAQCLFWHQAPG
jgi:hypothetical protein